MSGDNYDQTGADAAVAIETIGSDQSVSTQLDTTFEVLANNKRRYILYQFLEQETDVLSKTDLVAALFRNLAGDGATEKEIRYSLTHTQLPMLEMVGVIEYDRRGGTVRYNRSPALDEWLEHARYKETN